MIDQKSLTAGSLPMHDESPLINKKHSTTRLKLPAAVQHWSSAVQGYVPAAASVEVAPCLWANAMRRAAAELGSRGHDG